MVRFETGLVVGFGVLSRLIFSVCGFMMPSRVRKSFTFLFFPSDEHLHKVGFLVFFVFWLVCFCSTFGFSMPHVPLSVACELLLICGLFHLSGQVFCPWLPLSGNTH